MDEQETAEQLVGRIELALADFERTGALEDWWGYVTSHDVRELIRVVLDLQAELVAERERADKAERVMNIMADKDLGLFILAHSIAAARDASTKEE